MSTACPKGHRSGTSDYCSVCGAAIAAATADTSDERCPNCGSPPTPGNSCARCGFLVGAPDSVAPWVEENWQLVIRADREFYEMLEPDGTDFPVRTSSRRISLSGDHVGIGRRSKSKKVRPEIDLSDALEDTAVSHRHAVLMRQPRGSWALVDQESTNGTFLNDDQDPVPPNQPVSLSDGDRIHVGAWTTLTIERLDPAELVHFDAESRPSKDTRNVAHGRRPVEIDLLGPLRLRVLGEDASVTAPKERAVLSLLALRIGAPVSTGDFEWALWNDDPPPTANKALQGYVSNLRKRLPEDSIELTGQAYRLHGPKDVVDVFRFERRCGRGRALLTSGHPGAAVAELTRALELWRGEPLLDLADGPGAATDLVGLLERKSTAEEDRFEGRLQLGHHQELVADLRAAVAAEPLRQRRWAQLMLALHRSGRKREALQEFQRLNGLLDDEYGLTPSEELVQLDRAIMMDRADLWWTPPEVSGEPVVQTMA
jgi:DNA-binding SARP family transcriptional activator/pSer/pThr/pTyr-binding forkhead associated (FHA) protein